MEGLTPRELVTELDRHIVGQAAAKRAVAIALRNRWRRRQLPAELQADVGPKNILMIGPTGVGKTEIARRLARLAGAPFLKVEATKYTEVGYYGRDVESMVRELVENAIGLVRDAERTTIESEAKRRVEQRLVDLLAPDVYDRPGATDGEEADRRLRTRQKLQDKLAAGELEDREVEISSEQKNKPVVMGGIGLEQSGLDLADMFDKLMPSKTVRRTLKVSDARRVLFDQECETLINQEKVQQEAVALAENLGIIFVDEIDKVVASEGGRGADVSRQGVQRDLLPLVEGTTVQTRYGYVKTDHVLFIAAGAFHSSQPSDLMPELQGRFPIRVELSALTKEDFVRILTEPTHSLTKQYVELLKTEGVELSFRADGVEAMAEYAFRVNQTTQNIGARRLYTILERLLEELSFSASDMGGGRVEITADYVHKRLEPLASDENLSRFIL